MNFILSSRNRSFYGRRYITYYVRRRFADGLLTSRVNWFPEQRSKFRSVLKGRFIGKPSAHSYFGFTCFNKKRKLNLKHLKLVTYFHFEFRRHFLTIAGLRIFLKLAHLTKLISHKCILKFYLTSHFLNCRARIQLWLNYRTLLSRFDSYEFPIWRCAHYSRSNRESHTVVL